MRFSGETAKGRARRARAQPAHPTTSLTKRKTHREPGGRGRLPGGTWTPWTLIVGSGFGRALGRKEKQVCFLAPLSPHYRFFLGAPPTRRPTARTRPQPNVMAATAVHPPTGAPPPPPPGPTATSAAGLLALLSEPDPALSAAALRGLNACVPSFWFEIATSVALVEAKADDPGFEHRELAALVASKVRRGSGRWRAERRRPSPRKARAIGKKRMPLALSHARPTPSHLGLLPPGRAGRRPHVRPRRGHPV